MSERAGPGMRPRGATRRRALVTVVAGAVWLAAAAPVAAAQYALIVNGDDTFTHNYNVALALSSLLRLGYSPQRILVLAPAAGVACDPCPDRRQATPDAATAATPAAAPWRQPATGQGLRQALARLREQMVSGDQLLVYLTGHGYRIFGRAMLGLADGSISARDLLQRLAGLPFGKLVLIADQCYSGGFVDAAVALGRNVVAVSSTDDRHEVRCEPWVRPLWQAAGDAAGGNRPASIEAAFQIATNGVLRPGAGAGELPRYAATGSCAGQVNSF
jgi:hypothetical protein